MAKALKRVHQQIDQSAGLFPSDLTQHFSAPLRRYLSDKIMLLALQSNAQIGPIHKIP